MSLAKIEKLTPEQEALIPVCREKWRRLALSVEPVDRSLAADAIISAYALLGLPEPEIIFCDRPRILSLDSEYRLHAEGSPALQFADGYSLYAYRGIRLPEEYGKIHPKDWQAEWLLTETNAELRRAIVRGIGYTRLCQELQAVELDSWREYALLQIESGRDFEQIYLLKMTCPSTGDIYVMRVPPNMRQAREAIQWINWGIDPEEFIVET